MADKQYVNAARPLHRREQTNAEASPNVCVGPRAVIDSASLVSSMYYRRNIRIVSKSKVTA